MKELRLSKKVIETEGADEVLSATIITLEGQNELSGSLILKVPASTPNLLLGKKYFLVDESEYTHPVEEPVTP
jgi:hypothetical protein